MRYAVNYFYFLIFLVVGCSIGSSRPTMFMTMESGEETLPPMSSVEAVRGQGDSPQQLRRTQSDQAQSPDRKGQLPSCPGVYNAKWTNCIGMAKSSSGEEYSGQWRDGQANGQGMFIWPDGRKYVGEFRNSKYNGQGTYTWPDGNKYVGEFRDSRRSGHGTQTYPNGAKYIGEWRDGQPNGQGMEYGADGSVLRSGIWENGVFISGW